VACSDTSAAVEVWVNPLPQIADFPATVICNNEEVNLPIFSDLNSSYVWSADNNIFVDGEILTPTSGDVIVNSLSNNSLDPQFVTFTVVATSVPEGCPGPAATATVQVMPDVVLSSVASTSICSDAPVNAILETNVPSTFEWFVTVDNLQVTGESITGGVGNVIDDVLVNASNSDQIVIYSITPTSLVGDCEGSPQTLAVMVKPPIEIVNPLEVSICSGSPVNLGLQANTEVVFNWFASSSPIISGETTAIVNSDNLSDVLSQSTSEVQTVSYSVVATSEDDGCSSPIVTLTVHVNPIPEVSDQPNLSVCHLTPLESQEFSSPTADVEFLWTMSGGNAIGQFTPSGTGDLPEFVAVNFTDDPLISAVTVLAEFTSGGATCSSAPMNFTVQVQPSPDLNPLTNLVVCENDVIPAIIPTSPTASADFVWWVNSLELGLPAGGTGVIPSVAANNPLTSTQSTQIWVTAQVQNGAEICPGDTSFMTISVHPAPVVSPFVDEICPDESVYIPVTTDIPSTWVWQAVENPNVVGETTFPPQTGPTITDPLDHDMNTQQVVEYVVSPTAVGTGCPGPQVTLYGLINPLPYLAFSTLSESVCDSLTTTFVNNSTGNYSYSWDFGNGQFSTLENPTTIFVDAGTYVVELYGIDNSTGCENTLVETFDVDETPDPTFYASSTSECGVSEVSFDAAHHLPNWNYHWNFGDGSTSSQPFTVDHVYQPDGCYDVSLAIETDAGCEADAELGEQVCVLVEPSAQFVASNNNFEELSPEVFFENLSTNATQFSWLIDDELISTSEDFVHTFEGYGDFTVTLFASNGPGCYDIHKETITVNPFLIAFVPNAFTPGNTYDGHNDAFIPILSNYDIVDVYELRIFDRWGNMVFYSEDYNEHWLGNCQACPEPKGDFFLQNDVYTWTLKLEAEDAKPDMELKGFVTLIR
jgi:PKD repeat protein